LSPKGRCLKCQAASGVGPENQTIQDFSLLGSVSSSGAMTWLCVTGAHLETPTGGGNFVKKPPCVMESVIYNARRACNTLNRIPWVGSNMRLMNQNLTQLAVDTMSSIVGEVAQFQKDFYDKVSINNFQIENDNNTWRNGELWELKQGIMLGAQLLDRNIVILFQNGEFEGVGSHYKLNHRTESLETGSFLFDGTNGVLTDDDGDPIICRINPDALSNSFVADYNIPSIKCNESSSSGNGGVRSKLITLSGREIHPKALYNAVDSAGGYDEVVEQRKWQMVRRALQLPEMSSSGSQLKKAYMLYFNPINSEMHNTHGVSPGSDGSSNNTNRLKQLPAENVEQSEPLLAYKGFQVQKQAIFECVKSMGGYQKVDDKRKWSQVRKKLLLPHSTSGGSRMKAIYLHYFQKTFAQPKARKNGKK
tara:strand:- start:197 stop:1456 length:1260 start_codon:yes stop_codon:yes gene_type:complete